MIVNSKKNLFLHLKTSSWTKSSTLVTISTILFSTSPKPEIFIAISSNLFITFSFMRWPLDSKQFLYILSKIFKVLMSWWWSNEASPSCKNKKSNKHTCNAWHAIVKFVLHVSSQWYNWGCWRFVEIHKVKSSKFLMTPSASEDKWIMLVWRLSNISFILVFFVIFYLSEI